MANNLFDESNSSDSEGAAVRTNHDGSKGNIWNFGSQLKLDPKRQDGDDTNDTSEQTEVKEISI